MVENKTLRTTHTAVLRALNQRISQMCLQIEDLTAERNLLIQTRDLIEQSAQAQRRQEMRDAVEQSRLAQRAEMPGETPANDPPAAPAWAVAMKTAAPRTEPPPEPAMLGDTGFHVPEIPALGVAEIPEARRPAGRPDTLPTVERIAQFLRVNGPCKVKQIAEAINEDYQTTYNALTGRFRSTFRQLPSKEFALKRTEA